MLPLARALIFALMGAVTIACGRVGFDSVVDGSSGEACAIDGVIACYEMQDAQGGVTDLCGGGLDGTCQAGECPTSTGQAHEFDGVDDHHVVPHSAEWETLSGVTTAVRFRADNLSNPPENQTIVGKPFGAEKDNSWELVFLQSDPPEIRYFVTKEGIEQVLIDAPVPFGEGEWAFVAGTWDGADVRLYLDGELFDTATGADSIVMDDSPITLGADRNSGSIVSFFDGAIDAVCVYDRALTPAELEVVGELMER